MPDSPTATAPDDVAAPLVAPVAQSGPVARLRRIGYVEGTSTLLLFFVAMPLKYAANVPEAVTVVGSVHGVLFLLYVAAVLHVWYARRWPLSRVALAAAASVLPFGPFVFDRTLRHES